MENNNFKNGQSESQGEMRLIDFLNRWAERLQPGLKSTEPAPPGGTKVKRYRILLPVLKVLPAVTAILYILSFFVDDSFLIVIPYRAEPFDTKGLLRMIAVSGLIGYFTNYIAVKMLFFPRTRRPILGQGLIPANRERIVRRIADSIYKEIINHELIIEQVRESNLVEKYMDEATASLRELLQNNEFRGDLTKLAEFYINNILRSEIVGRLIAQIAASYLGGQVGGLGGAILGFFAGKLDLKEKIGELLSNVNLKIDPEDPDVSKFLDKIPDEIHGNRYTIEEVVLLFMSFIAELADIRSVIMANLNSFDERQLEDMLLKTTSDQLDYIQYLGSLLGMLGGFFILVPLEAFVVLGSVSILLFVLDYLIPAPDRT